MRSNYYSFFSGVDEESWNELTERNGKRLDYRYPLSYTDFCIIMEKKWPEVTVGKNQKIKWLIFTLDERGGFPNFKGLEGRINEIFEQDGIDKLVINLEILSPLGTLNDHGEIIFHMVSIFICCGEKEIIFHDPLGKQVLQHVDEKNLTQRFISFFRSDIVEFFNNFFFGYHDQFSKMINQQIFGTNDCMVWGILNSLAFAKGNKFPHHSEVNIREIRDEFYRIFIEYDKMQIERWAKIREPILIKLVQSLELKIEKSEEIQHFLLDKLKSYFYKYKPATISFTQEEEQKMMNVLLETANKAISQDNECVDEFDVALNSSFVMELD